MITREDINWTSDQQICFLCRKSLNNSKCVALAEVINNKGMLFDPKCFKSIRICLTCWEQVAGKEWMFSE